MLRVGPEAPKECKPSNYAMGIHTHTQRSELNVHIMLRFIFLLDYWVAFRPSATNPAPKGFTSILQTGHGYRRVQGHRPMVVPVQRSYAAWENRD